MPAFLAPLALDLESAGAFELDARLRRALRIEQRWLAEIGPLLREVAHSRSYRSRGCSNLAAFARDWLGMCPRKAQALLRLERASEVCPALGEAYRTGRLTGVQAHALIPVLLLEHAEPWRSEWVAHAEAVSVRRVEEDVERALVTGRLDPRSLSEDVQNRHPKAEKSDDECLESQVGTATLLLRGTGRRGSPVQGVRVARPVPCSWPSAGSDAAPSVKIYHLFTRRSQ